MREIKFRAWCLREGPMGDCSVDVYASTPTETRIGAVEWSDRDCCFYLDGLLLEPTPRDIEVIGNIYETPNC